MSKSEQINLPEFSQMPEHQQYLDALQQDTGVDFHDSIEKVSPETEQLIRKHCNITANRIIETCGYYMPEDQQTWLQDLANTAMVLTRNDLNRFHTYANAIQSIQNGETINLQDTVQTLNNIKPDLVHDFGAQASTWIPFDKSDENRFVFFENDSFLSIPERHKEKWLQSTTAEELIHALDHIEYNNSFTLEQTKLRANEIKLLHEGATETLMQEILPPETVKARKINDTTKQEIAVWKELENIYGKDHLRQFFFMGQGFQKIDLTELLDTTEKISKQYAEKQKE